jgi:hypothetical protein
VLPDLLNEACVPVFAHSGLSLENSANLRPGPSVSLVEENGIVMQIYGLLASKAIDG